MTFLWAFKYPTEGLVSVVTVLDESQVWTTITIVTVSWPGTLNARGEDVRLSQILWDLRSSLGEARIEQPLRLTV
jgi:hypothetical protein